LKAAVTRLIEAGMGLSPENYDRRGIKFDLLMTDVVMPQLAGGAAEQLKERLPN